MNGDERHIMLFFWFAVCMCVLLVMAVICVGIYEAAVWIRERWKK